MRDAFKQVLGFDSMSATSTETQKRNKRVVKFMAMSAATAVLVLEPSLALAVPDLDTNAVTTTGANGISRAVNAIVQTLTGTLGQSIAVLAVIVMGFMAMFGRLAWDHAMKVILGIAIVFGAATIITWITVGAGEG